MYKAQNPIGLYRFTLPSATEYVQQNNLTLATMDQLRFAQQAGAQNCNSGIVRDGYGYPMQYASKNCGNSAGVITTGKPNNECMCGVTGNNCAGYKCQDDGRCDPSKVHVFGCAPIWLYGIKPPPGTDQIEPFYVALPCNIAKGCSDGNCIPRSCINDADCGTMGQCNNNKCTQGGSSGTCVGADIWSQYDPRNNP
jgi:hypothetical protein